MDKNNAQVQSVQSESPAQQQSILSKKNNTRKVFWIFFIISFLIAFGAGGYLLGANKSKSQPIAQVSPTPIASPTLDVTAGWKTYINSQYGFELKYPQDERIVQEGAQGKIVSVNLIASDFRLASTGLSIETIKDGCRNIQTEELVARNKIINGLTFFAINEVREDSSAGGERHAVDIYKVTHNQLCFSLSLSVGYTDVTFAANPPSAQEIKQQQDWIQTQKQLNDQILSTLKFANQNSAAPNRTSLNSDQIFLEASSQLNLVRNQLAYFRIFGQDKVQYSVGGGTNFAYKYLGKWQIAGKPNAQGVADCRELVSVPEQYWPPCFDSVTNQTKYIDSQSQSLNYPPSQMTSYIGN